MVGINQFNQLQSRLPNSLVNQRVKNLVNKALSIICDVFLRRVLMPTNLFRVYTQRNAYAQNNLWNWYFNLKCVLIFEFGFNLGLICQILLIEVTNVLMKRHAIRIIFIYRTMIQIFSFSFFSQTIKMIADKNFVSNIKA